jgi:Mrp family chromosome partitioning ATPase
MLAVRVFLDRGRRVPVGVSEFSGALPAPDPSWDRERGPSLVRALWRYRYMVIVVALLSAVGGYVYESRHPPVYEAAVSIVLRNPYDMTLFRQERGVAFTDPDRYLNSQADMIRSPEVAARASELLGGELRPAQIRQSITAESSTKIFQVTVRSRFDDARRAANVVNAVAEAYREVSEENVDKRVAVSVAHLRRLEADLRAHLAALPSTLEDPSVAEERDSLSAQIAAIQEKDGQIRTDAAVYPSGIDRIDLARPPETPISDSPRRRAVILGLLGFIAALVVAFWRGERVRVIDSAGDAAGAVDAPLLGVLPRHPADTGAAAAPVITAPESSAAKEHQFIASTLALVSGENETRVLLVTSPERGHAKSVTALNVALSAALDQRSVILVDLDASGELTSLLHADNRSGVSDLLAHSAAGDFALSDYAAPTKAVDGFRFVPAGRTTAYGRAAAEAPQIAKVLAQLQQEADFIVVDGPPLLESPGGMKLAAAVDGVVLVVRRGTAANRLRQARALLAVASAPIVGVVFDRSRLATRWRTWHPWRGEARRRAPDRA